jgi:hypothetical protein
MHTAFLKALGFAFDPYVAYLLETRSPFRTSITLLMHIRDRYCYNLDGSLAAVVGIFLMSRLAQDGLITYTSPGPKCLSSAGDDLQSVPDGFMPETVRKLEQLASSTDISYPERIESTMLEVISVARGWPAHVQPLPILHSQLAISYHAKQNHHKEVHYLLHLCFNSDPVLYPSKVHPARVATSSC